jgi:hypothetical protein
MGTRKGALAVNKQYVKSGLGLVFQSPFADKKAPTFFEAGASYALSPRTPKGAPLKGTSTDVASNMDNNTL